jgi:hypothetical protein
MRVLTDPDVSPAESQIRSALGGATEAWQVLESALAEPPFALALSWQYFRDGGWLCRALRGRKTVAWLAVWRDCATVTFYFAARHREDLVSLPITDGLRRQVAEAEMTGRMLPFVIEVRTLTDVDAVREVMRYKLAAK